MILFLALLASVGWVTTSTPGLVGLSVSMQSAAGRSATSAVASSVTIVGPKPAVPRSD